MMLFNRKNEEIFDETKVEDRLGVKSKCTKERKRRNLKAKYKQKVL
jgi:hypothetical protein